MKAVNIQWDIDDDWEEAYLPDEVEIPEDIIDDDEISDYITDLTGFCHNGYELVDDEDEDGEPYDYCYECGGYGDDYYIDENGEMQSSCAKCPLNPRWIIKEETA